MVIDILLILFALTGFWLGYTKGIVGTLISVASYVAAVLLTLLISPWVMELMIRTLKTERMFALIFGTIGVFILLTFLIRWVVKSLGKRMEKGKLSTLSKVLGGILMVFAGVILYSFILLALDQLNMLGTKMKETSISYSFIEEIPGKARAVIEEFKPLFRRYWELMQETIHEGKSEPTE